MSHRFQSLDNRRLAVTLGSVLLGHLVLLGIQGKLAWPKPRSAEVTEIQVEILAHEAQRLGSKVRYAEVGGTRQSVDLIPAHEASSAGSLPRSAGSRPGGLGLRELPDL